MVLVIVNIFCFEIILTDSDLILNCILDLKSHLRESIGFKSLSKAFVMVNVEDNEEPKDEKYKPDGGYIPRILFMNHLGEVQTQIINENGNPKYKYFYTDDRAGTRNFNFHYCS